MFTVDTQLFDPNLSKNYHSFSGQGDVLIAKNVCVVPGDMYSPEVIISNFEGL